MDWKIQAELLLLAPFAFVWAPFFVVETARLIAAIREG
jgi:hypothetical protein